uniref:Uncharacterized protein n=1 Tax=Plectus sambesii TaxID=2011161 RepID=A0A914WRM1_9BILA
MGEDWGVVDEGDLFSTAGTTKSLNDLVESLVSGVAAAEPRFPLSTDHAPVQIVSGAVPTQHRPTCAPKILKVRPKTAPKQPSAKRVTFDVQKLAASESTGAAKEDATARLVLQLGALPAKKKSLNYKTLKDDRRRSNEAAKDQSLINLKPHTFKKNARKKGKKQRAKK